MASIKIKYPDAFAAIGRYVDKRNLTSVCVLEFEQGVIVVGDVLYEVGEGMNRRTETHVLSHEELERLIKGG